MALICPDATIELPWEKVRWDIVRMTGWTLEYIDALTMRDFHEWLQVQDGETKAQNSLLNKGR